MPRHHIIAAAEIVKKVNAHLDLRNRAQLSSKASLEVDSILADSMTAVLTPEMLNDSDLMQAIRNAATCSIYIKLEDLLVSLEKEAITLK